MTEFCFLGIDPGQTGALAAITRDGETMVFDWEGIESIGPAITSIRARWRIAGACIEHVHSMPKQGVASSFNFGVNFGAWQGALAALLVPYSLVSPQKWQRSMLDDTAGDTKERSLAGARRLFPDCELHLKKHNGRADALHLARYAMVLNGRAYL